jgi:hypothetical protein
MARRDADADAKHDAVVENVATHLDEEWEHVFAVDIQTKHGSPSKIDGHLPDVMARSGDRAVVVEVETDPADDPEQRRAFSEWAAADASRAYVGILATDYDSWEVFESTDAEEETLSTTSGN